MNMRRMSGRWVGRSDETEGMETASPSSEMYWDMWVSTWAKKGVVKSVEAMVASCCVVGGKDTNWKLQRKRYGI